MNLKELTESYQEYTLTEAYLTEGLKIFKESKNLYKIASKITSKLGSRKYNNPEAITVAKKLAADITKLGDEYKRVEDDFANKKLDKAKATAKLKALKNSNDSISGYIKSAKTKNLLGKIGLGVVITGLAVLLGSIAMNPSLIASIGSGVKDFAAAASAKIGSFFSKKSYSSTRQFADENLEKEWGPGLGTGPRAKLKIKPPSSVRRFADENLAAEWGDMAK